MNDLDALLSLIAEITRPDLAWMELAACAEIGGDIWHPEKGGSVLPAKRVCMACEVREQCLDYALKHDERWGIWGGLSENQRSQLRAAGKKRAA